MDYFPQAVKLLLSVMALFVAVLRFRFCFSAWRGLESFKADADNRRSVLTDFALGLLSAVIAVYFLASALESALEEQAFVVMLMAAFLSIVLLSLNRRRPGR